MSVTEYINQFITALRESLNAETFAKISLGNYKGAEEALKQLLIRKVVIKREDKLAFTYRYKTRDVLKNYAINEAIDLIGGYLENGFKIATLFTTENDLILEELNNGKIVLRKGKASSVVAPSVYHDKEKPG